MANVARERDAGPPLRSYRRSAPQSIGGVRPAPGSLERQDTEPMAIGEKEDWLAVPMRGPGLAGVKLPSADPTHALAALTPQTLLLRRR